MGTLVAVLLGLTIEHCEQPQRSSEGCGEGLGDGPRPTTSEPLERRPAAREASKPARRPHRSPLDLVPVDVICRRVRVGKQERLACTFTKPVTRRQSKQLSAAAAKSRAKAAGNSGLVGGSDSPATNRSKHTQKGTGGAAGIPRSEGTSPPKQARKWIPEPVSIHPSPSYNR